MPKQKRWVIKRDIEHAINNIDRAINDLVTAGHEFEGVHGEYYDAFSMAVSNLDRIKTTVSDIKDLI